MKLYVKLVQVSLMMYYKKLINFFKIKLLQLCRENIVQRIVDSL